VELVGSTQRLSPLRRRQVSNPLPVPTNGSPAPPPPIRVRRPSMANPRRAIALHIQTQPPPLPSTAAALPPHTLASSLLHFLKRPASFPFLLSLFVLLTWLSLRFHHPSPPPSLGGRPSVVHEPQANLVRFPAELYPTPIARDGRGWLLDPVAAARDAGLPGERSSTHASYVTVLLWSVRG
jgi:hypothetical protein